MLKYIKTFPPFFLFALMCIMGNMLFILFLITQLYRLNIIRDFSRDIIMISWKLFLWLIKYFKWISFQNIKINIQDKGCLIIANHPSILDVVFLLSQIRGCNCVVKKELKKNILLYPAVKCSHYITNEFNEEFLNKCIKVLQNGENLIIFPEGTRTVNKIKMHKGVAYIAIYGASKIIPFYITIEPKCLGKYDKWYNLPENIQYDIKYLNEISIQDFDNSNVASLRVRHLYSYITSIYEKYNK